MTSTDLDFCRLCFREDGNVSVFNYECDDAWSLTDRIFECVSVQISQNDKLPSMICRLCLDHVIKWCEFKTFCDRNQRSWFLWLKSLSQRTPQEICEGLAENARKKSLELGFTRNSTSPRRSAFHNYKPHSASAPKRSRNADEIPGEEVEECQNSHSKELRIESTLSLVTDKETILSPFQSPQKLTNGYVILDTHNLSERFGKSTENEHPPSNSKTQSESCIIIESPKRINHIGDEEQQLFSFNDKNKDATDDPKQNDNSRDEVTKTQSDSLALTRSNHVQDCEDNFEVESAFDSEDMVTDEPLSDREVALLNGEEPLEEEENVDSVEFSTPIVQSSGNEAPSEFSMPSLPKRFVSACPREILKERLMQGVDKRSTNDLASQPKRPDTPYPHEILKNMGHVLDGSSYNRVLPQPTASPIVNNLDDVRNFHFSTPLSGGSEVTQTSPPRGLKPVSLSHLMKPQTIPSDRNSESSDSSSIPQLNLQWRIKQEPVSEPEDSDDNEGHFSNISIKFEPMDYVEPCDEQPMSSPEMPPPNSTYCDICLKHFSSHTQLVRHIHSKIHKRVASFAALGNRVDSQIVSQMSKEIRSQAYFRSCAKKQMVAMANEKNISGLQSSTPVVASSPLVEIPSSSNASLRQADNELLECKVCNVVLKSRSFKIKHDNSFSHKCQMEAVASSLDSTVDDTPGVILPADPSMLQAPMYTCPFASCSSAFSDGGQLIVHMHTHGISLPIHEVNKQIELSKTSIQKKPPVKPTATDSTVNKFTCRRCGRSFPKALSLSNHLRRCRIVPTKMTAGLSIPCPVCQIMQKNPRTLSYHLKTYHPHYDPNSAESIPPPPTKEFVCNVCNKSFSTRIHLRGHTYKVHCQKPVACKFCKKIYNSKDNLYVHYKSAHLKMKEGEYACYTCFKVFQSYSECCKHRKGGCSLKMKVFSCTECGHSFRSQFSLDKHKEEHASPVEVQVKEQPPLDLSFLENVLNCICNICNRVYSSYYNLRRHVRTSHITETNNCSLDDLIKASVSGLNVSSAPEIKEESFQEANTPTTNVAPVIRRTRNINCEKNFGCLYCESKFSTNSNRLSHMKTVCRFCPDKVVCTNCKVGRWPWVTGHCKNCGKDVNTKKRTATTKVENASKRFRSSGSEQTDSFPQEVEDFQIPASEIQYESAKSVKFSKSRVYRCAVGKRTFLSQKAMFNHSSNCDGSCKDQGVKCKVCNQGFANPRLYIRHKPCVGKKSIQNPILGNRKPLRINMNDPLRIIPCNFCDYKFKSRKNVCHHMRTVHNYYASVDRKKRALERIANATKGESITNICSIVEIPDQEFNEGEPDCSTSHEIADNVPSNGRACPACFKPFANHQAVVQHVRTHHKNKFSVLECTFCSKSILKRQLYEHGFTCIKDQLANINTLECVVCSTVFYSGDEEDTLSLKLQEHIMNCCGKLTLAKGEKFRNKEKFLCLKCCMLFSSKKTLYTHSFERHGILVQTSPTSQQKFNPTNTDEEVLDVTQSDSMTGETDSVFELASATSDSNLTVSTAEDTHPFKCHRCCKRFKTAKGLHSHKTSAHMYQSRKKKKPSPNLKCKFCQRQFYNEMKLRNHEKVHGIVKEVVRTEEEENPEQPASPDVEIVSET